MAWNANSRDPILWVFALSKRSLELPLTDLTQQVAWPGGVSTEKVPVSFGESQFRSSEIPVENSVGKGRENA